jgi:hypothetical protein
VAAYRGFVFASLAASGPTLAEHLGPATRLIDRSCDLSPEGAGRAVGGVGATSVRRQLEDAARERQRRLSPRLRAPRDVHEHPLAVPARGRRRARHQGGGAHRLCRVEGEWRMRAKTVVLVNAAEPLPNLAFLI